MKNKVGIILTLLAVATLTATAQESQKGTGGQTTDEHMPAPTPLRVQVVFAEYDGEKKVSSLPYTFTVNADERQARPGWHGSQIRNGARIPISTGKDQFIYIDIGTNVDCSAHLQEDGHYKLQLTLERSSISPDTPSGSSNPVVRQFRADLNPVLKLTTRTRWLRRENSRRPSLNLWPGSIGPN